MRIKRASDHAGQGKEEFIWVKRGKREKNVYQSEMWSIYGN
jgi:hypothetical protein